MPDKIRKVNKDAHNIFNHVIRSGFVASTGVRSLDVAQDGTLYVVDNSRHVIYKFFDDGKFYGALIGHEDVSGDVESSGDKNAGQVARLSSPLGICIDESNNIYFGDQSSSIVRKGSPSGRSITFLGRSGVIGDTVSTNGTGIQFAGTTHLGLAINKSKFMYIADTGNHKIKKVFPEGKSIVFAGHGTGMANGVGSAALFASPQDCCVDNSENVYVADTGNNRIRKIDSSGKVTVLAGQASSGSTDAQGTLAKFNSPRRIAMDPSGYFMYVLDHGNSAIRRVDIDGTVTTFCHYNPTTTGTGDICVDRNGCLYIIENHS